MGGNETSGDLSLDIAVIGMAARFPGADTVAEFWQNLCAGRESITVLSEQDLRQAGVEAALRKHPDYVRALPEIGDPALFDAAFFDVSPREAQCTDPQHRLFLECAWSALEDAGYDAERYPGLIGVYGGSSMNTYLLWNPCPLDLVTEQLALAIGNEKDYLTSRVSYKLNLKGPSVTVQTACSTSLVAVHLACQSLLNQECDMALAGGVSVRLPHPAGYLYQEGDIRSPDGHCRAFDAQAQGTIFGSGVGLVVLKRLADAVAAGDAIAAVIKGSAVNNDGSSKVAYTAPSVDSQSHVILQALANAGVTADTITYVEGHGTGTALGDPIEVTALTNAFRAQTDNRGFCAIGSVKTNVGHLDGAAGVAGLIKTILALQHGVIPPSLHFEKANPQIDFANSPFYVNTSASAWNPSGHPRRAGVSALGVGGTNVHVILEEPPAAEPSGASRAWHLLLLSAKTATALETATANLARHLEQHPEGSLADVAYTLQVGRKMFPYRRMMVCPDLGTAVHGLQTRDPRWVTTAAQESLRRDVALLFSGQGAQYVNMGRELYQTEPVFRRALERCAEILRPHLPLDLRELLYPEHMDAASAARRLTQTSITQPVLFAFEYALAQLWMSWGVRPRALAGHSLGEYVAACLAGVFSLEEALPLVAVRGRLVQGLPGGSMLAVSLAEEEILPLLGENLSLAVVNGPSQCVVSGPEEAIGGLQERLSRRQVRCHRLHTSHAFHSAMVEPVVEALAHQIGQMKLRPPQIPFVSNVTGTWITPEEAIRASYWATHLRRTVRFSDCLQELMREPNRVLLEVGPGCTLCTLAKQHPHKAPGHVVLSSTPHPQEQVSDEAFVLDTLGRLWLAGIPIDWSAFHAGARRQRVGLPTYPFERQRHWITSVKPSRGAARRTPAVPEVPPENPSSDPSHSRPSDPRAECGEAGTPVERSLAEIWRETLGVTQVGAQDDFFALGGNSLVAVHVTARIRQLLGVKLAVRDIFAAPTISRLAETIEAARPACDAARAPGGDGELKNALKRLGSV
jgi:acyl transferase domain-containing protein